MTDPSQPLFLFGPGYSARALAARWRGPVIGTFRSDERRHKLEQGNIQPVPANNETALRDAMQEAHVIISAPPNESGCPGLAVLGAFAHSAASITYLSTTGVYGDLDGGWAMEWSPPNPQSVRAGLRLKAEQAWREASDTARVVRLPGIYGPGRSAFERLASGRARRIVKDGQVFSRAHVEDIASGLHALIQSGKGGVYNLCDDLAAPPQDVISFAARISSVKRGAARSSSPEESSSLAEPSTLEAGTRSCSEDPKEASSSPPSNCGSLAASSMLNRLTRPVLRGGTLKNPNSLTSDFRCEGLRPR